MIEDLGELLAVLHDLRVVISADGNHLAVDMPQAANTSELRAAIAAHKQGLLDYLAGKFTIHLRPDPDPLWTDPRPDLGGRQPALDPAAREGAGAGRGGRARG